MVRLKDNNIKLEKGVEEFQFLMVRLKGTRCWQRACRFNISIPYGAIKSL